MAKTENPQGTIRITVDKDALFGPGGFSRVKRCCNNPLPYIRRPIVASGQDSQTEFYCFHCKTLWGIMAWKTEDPRKTREDKK